MKGAWCQRNPKIDPFPALGSKIRRSTLLVKKRAEMGRPDRKRRLALEDKYWKMMAAGLGTVEACRRLGIARATG